MIGRVIKISAEMRQAVGGEKEAFDLKKMGPICWFSRVGKGNGEWESLNCFAFEAEKRKH